MTTLYTIIQFITFPGCLTRAFFQQIVCRICKIPVEDSRYLRYDEMAGHIEHHLAKTPRSAFALCFVPAFFNILLAFSVGTMSAFRLFYIGAFTTPTVFIDVVCVWFALSLLTNTAPLREDCAMMWSLVYSKQSNFLQKIFYFPGALICRVDAFFDAYCINFVLAIVFVAVAAAM